MTTAGSIEPGALASYAVWELAGPTVDGLPEMGSPDAPLPTCVRTVVAGAVAYDAEELS